MHVARTNAEKEFPVVGIDYGDFKEDPGDADDDDVKDHDPNTQEEVANSSGCNTPQGKPNPILCGRNSEGRWILFIVSGSEGSDAIQRKDS